MQKYLSQHNPNIFTQLDDGSDDVKASLPPPPAPAASDAGQKTAALFDDLTFADNAIGDSHRTSERTTVAGFMDASDDGDALFGAGTKTKARRKTTVTDIFADDDDDDLDALLAGKGICSHFCCSDILH